MRVRDANCHSCRGKESFQTIFDTLPKSQHEIDPRCRQQEVRLLRITFLISNDLDIFFLMFSDDLSLPSTKV